MIIKNGLIFGSDRKFVRGSLGMKGDIFVPVQEAEGEIIDAENNLCLPGLIDLHFHGCMNVDFSDAAGDSLKVITRYQGENGVTSICPATLTLPVEKILQVMENAADYEKNHQRGTGARLLGINLEGPFLNPRKKGAHKSEEIRVPEISLFKKLQEASGGLIRLVDLAPETEGAMAFIKALKDEVCLSLAHSEADYVMAGAAFSQGVRHVTHLYNGMPPFHHREPGIVGAALDHKDVTVELICDGIHLHPAVVRGTFAMFGSERIVMISDSMRATGLPEGEYSLGGQKVTVREGRATLEDGTLAGSTSHLMTCLRQAVLHMGIPAEEAIPCVTANPARVLGVDHFLGSIEVGKQADLVIVDPEFHVKKVFISGKQMEVNQ